MLFPLICCIFFLRLYWMDACLWKGIPYLQTYSLCGSLSSPESLSTGNTWQFQDYWYYPEQENLTIIIPFYRIKHIIVVPSIYTVTRYHPTVSLPDCGLNGECLYFVGLESCVATLFSLATNVMRTYFSLWDAKHFAACPSTQRCVLAFQI